MDMSLQFNQLNQTSIEELFDGLSPNGRYANLQLILSRNFDVKELPSYNLWLSRNAFGKVRLDDLDFDGSYHLDILDFTTGFKKVVSIDINDRHFQFILIDWNDIRTMIMAENKPMLSDNDLLEFEY